MDNNIGARLNELRVARKMTYTQWSQQSGVPEGTIKSITSSNTVSPGFETVCALLHSLGVSADEFYIGVPIVQPSAVVQPSTQYSTSEVIKDMKTIAADAMEAASRDAYVKVLSRDRNFWRVLVFALLAILAFWLQWDLRHPNAGLIQYETASVEYRQESSDDGDSDDTLAVDSSLIVEL